jgi:monofunctional glycosyltransferase
LAWLLAVWPPPVWYRTHWPARTAFMAMRASAGTSLRYRPLALDSMAPALRLAAVTGEDARFWSHRGIDYQEVRHALGYRRARFAWDSPRDRDELWRVLGRAWGRRDALRGASTITQQVVKNLYLSPSRNPLRKLKEAVTAYRLELALGKRRILELYLNTAELGDGVWGAEAASRRYFNRSARRLSDTQAAALAASLPFPLRSNPAYRPNRMRRRQELILRRMRGEPVEVPPMEDEPLILPGDTIQWTPGVDSLLDSLRAPVETLPPLPADSSPATSRPPERSEGSGRGLRLRLPHDSSHILRALRRLLGSALEGVHQPPPGIRAALGHQQRRQPRADRQPQHRRDPPLPAALLLPPTQLPPDAPQRDLGAAPDLPQASADQLAGLGAFRRREQQRGARADGERQQGEAEGAAAGAVVGGEVELLEVGAHMSSTLGVLGICGTAVPFLKLQRCPRRGREHRHRGGGQDVNPPGGAASPA